MKRLDSQLMETIADQAGRTDRLRRNYNFHEPTDKVQRFINVLQPGTYIRPHRHLRPPGSNGFEFFLVIQGELGLLLFDTQAQIWHQERLSARGPTYGIELAAGVFHTLVALASNTVILEIKEGPYLPTTDKDFLPQFALEGTLASPNLVSSWEKRFAA